MKYILAIGIEYQKFKSPATITVSIGNRFIDNFQLTHDHPSTMIDKHKVEHAWYHKFKKSHWLDQIKTGPPAPSFFKIYHLDERYLEGTLDINVQNSNSNYTNGFMNRSSLIKFPAVALFPKYMTDNNGENLMECLIRLSTAYWNFWEEIRGIEDAPELEGFVRPKWPFAESFEVITKNEHNRGIKIGHGTYPLGGSFTAKFPIRRKNKIKYLSSVRGREIGFPIWFSYRMKTSALILASYKKLINMYNENK